MYIYTYGIMYIWIITLNYEIELTSIQLYTGLCVENLNIFILASRLHWSSMHQFESGWCLYIHTHTMKNIHSKAWGPVEYNSGM